ncbi:hypothetical protein FACHB389_25680 [Nostoc calcicola FACHB-389]|nr:hypothetical protein [Nostoc calcicola FACHB-3891]OKH29745.1 hypothetical protein FACHB389_25680 [Nostoc calcicola FACHB-389]
MNTWHRLIPFSFIGINLFIYQPTQAKFVDCSKPTQKPSQFDRNIVLDKFGISMKIPANYRAISMADGTVDIVDGGTYEEFVCRAKNPGAGGEGYYSITVYESKASYLYEGVWDKVPKKENMYIIWEKKSTGQDGLYFNYLNLRIKTKKGLVEIYAGDEQTPVHEDDVKAALEEILKIAEKTEIL